MKLKKKRGESQPGVRVWCKRNAVATTDNLDTKINLIPRKEKPGENQPGVCVWCKRKAVATTENLDNNTNIKTIDLLVVHPIYVGGIKF